MVKLLKSCGLPKTTQNAIIVKHFEKHEWFCRGIDLIQAVNLLRISPYAKSEATHRFVIDALRELGFDS